MSKQWTAYSHVLYIGRKHNWKNICHRNTHCSQWGRHVVIVGIGVQELCRFSWVAWEPMSHHNPLSQWDDPTVTCHTHCSQHVVTYRHTQAQRYSKQGKKPDRNSLNQTSQHNFIPTNMQRCPAIIMKQQQKLTESHSTKPHVWNTHKLFNISESFQWQMFHSKSHTMIWWNKSNKMQQLRFYSQWLYSTCFGQQSHPSSGVHMLYMATGMLAHLGCKFVSSKSSIVVEL